MEKLLLYGLLAVVWVFGNHYKTLVPKTTIRTGEVIQESDLDRGYFVSTSKLDLATDPRAVVGHKALKSLPGGSNIHLSDISQ